MYPVSDDFKNIIYGSDRELHAKIEVDLASGAHLILNDYDLMESGFEIEDAVSESDKLQVGAAIINQLTLILNNFEDKSRGSNLSGYDFTGAVIRPYAGLVVKKDWHGDTVEWVPKGVFTAEKPTAAGSRITVTALDNMAKLDTVYSKSTLTYPATLGGIAADACSVCGVTLATATFPNSDYVVTKRPTEDSITCREILSYAAQLAGCFARCNTNGAVEIRWYAEVRTPCDVGSGASSSSIADTDTVVTGVQIQQSSDDSKNVYSSGTDGFIVRIQDNPLAQDGLQAVADALGARLNGFTFRAYTVSSLSNPAIEAGDAVNMTDSKGVIHKTLVSRLTYSIDGNEEYNADAETAAENQSERFTAAQKAQETADQAQEGVDEAKTEITQLNGEIVLKADKGSLVAEINISPETIKISANKLELDGLVTIRGVEDGTTEINGGCIKTGKIVSSDDNSSFSVNLETGEIVMKRGTFSGSVLWGTGSYVKKDGDALLINNGSNVQISSINDDINLVAENGQIALDAGSSGKVGVIGRFYLNGSRGYSGNVGIMMSDKTKRTLQFEDGILMNNDA